MSAEDQTEVVDANPVDLMRQANVELVESLHHQGIGVDTTVFIGIKLDTMVDLLLHGPFRQIFDMQFEMRLHEFLESQKSQALQAKLMEGVHK